jgi:hypothetical protein
MGRRAQAIAIGVVVAVMLAGSAWAWAQVPAEAHPPMQWMFAGTPDRSGDRFAGMFLPFCHL